MTITTKKSAIFVTCIVLALLYIPQMGVEETSDYHIAELQNSNHLDFSRERKRVLSSDVTGKPPAVTCKPIRNVAFIKTHKAGSSTIANILQRFGITYDLNFALPRKKMNTYGFNYIVKPGQNMSAEKLIPLPPGQSYNVLWSHSIYDKAGFHSVLPNNTAYISIIREPFQQFVSSFEYYNVIKSLSKIYPWVMGEKNPISAFLSSPVLGRLFIAKRRHYGYLRNKQAQDLGFGEAEFQNETKLASYIKELAHDFSTIMIMEHFDESMLILKHKLCWNLKDILYIPKNKNAKKPNRTFTPQDHENHRQYSPIDYALYDHFLNIYNENVKKPNSDFLEELTLYKNVLQDVRSHCYENKSLLVPSSKWNKSFTVSQADCKLMTMSELQGLVKLLTRLNQKFPGVWTDKLIPM